MYEIFAVCAPGLEPVVDGELKGLGISGEVETGGVCWKGELRDLYRANLHLRSASRIVVRIARFRARSFIELERHVRRIDWSAHLPGGASVRLRVTSRKSRLYHEGAIRERFERFIAESINAGISQDVSADHGPVDADPLDSSDGVQGAQLIVVRFFRDECIVSLDASGALLHRRGYRLATAKAPLRETLAAAIIIAAGWDGSTPLIDPFCGSGTILIEAALIARRIPPGMAGSERQPRAFAFQRWPNFDVRLWTELVAAARAGIREQADVVLRGSDRDAGAIEGARSNAERAGVGDDIRFEVAPVSSAHPPGEGEPGLLVTNPPYGGRIGDRGPLRDLYAAFGHVLREHFGGWSLALLSAEEALTGQMRFEATEILKTTNGGIPVRLIRTEIPPVASNG